MSKKLLQYYQSKMDVGGKVLPKHQSTGLVFPKETLKDRQYAYKTIRPSDYFEASNYMRYLFDNEREDFDDPRSEEAFRMYLGLEQKPKYFTPSQYRPTINRDPKGGTYYKVDPQLEQEIFNSFKDKIKLNEIYPTSENEVQSYFDESEPGVWEENGQQYKALVPGDTNMLFGRPMVSNARALGKFVVSRGKDEAGEYLSYSDQYDFPDWMQDRMKGKPYKIYGRVYYPKDKKQYGGPIVDPRGQWAHPGQVTRIPSSRITMQQVPYPVYGVGSNGKKQMMYPNQEYDFGNAEYVDEFPVMQNGGPLPKYQTKGQVRPSVIDLPNITVTNNSFDEKYWYDKDRTPTYQDSLYNYNRTEAFRKLMNTADKLPQKQFIKNKEEFLKKYNKGVTRNMDPIGYEKHPHGPSMPIYKKPAERVSPVVQKVASQPVVVPTPAPLRQYSGSPVYSPGAGSGMRSALVGFSDKMGNITYIKPEDYQRFAVPQYAQDYIKSLDKKRGGGSLDRTVTCSSCGWSWKFSDGGKDPVTCHKCGGQIKMKNGGQMIRRVDGSYSQRGLWDNIRANKGSGKKPTKEMLEQERKIKAKNK